MSEAGEWVEVSNPVADPDWNNGKWRSSQQSIEYVDGIQSGDYQIPTWEKWVPAVPDVPIEAGVYLDKSDDIWVLTSDHKWYSFDHYEFYPYGRGVTEYPKEYAPFRKATVKESI